MSKEDKPLAGVQVGSRRRPRGVALARVTRWEWEGLDALSAKLGISRERIVERAVRSFLKSNGITGPKTQPPRSPVIRIVSLICR